MDRVSVTTHGGQFSVRIDGTSIDALALRRIVNGFSNDPPGEPLAGSVTYRILPGRIRALFTAVAPNVRRSGTALKCDDAAGRELAALREEIGSLRHALAGDLSPRQFQLGPGFKRVLTDKQREGVAKLLALPHGANFSVPGAGKTTMTLALHQVLRQTSGVTQLLVVAPRNAFGPWEEEVRACLDPAPPVIRLAGGASRIRQILRARTTASAVLLIGYQQAWYAFEDLEAWAAQHPGLHVVLDESHRVKNPRRGAWATTVLRLGTFAARRDILTGTPAPHATEDLATQLGFLWPFQPIIPDASLRDPDAEDEVTRRLRPLYVRITKRDLGLPKPTIVRTKVEMGPIQKAIHDRIARNTASGRSRRRGSDALTDLRPHVIRLLQLASNPALALTEADEFRLPPLSVAQDAELEDLFERYTQYEVPPKLACAVERVRARAERGEKTIVWSSFVRNLELLARLLASFDPVVLHGAVPTALDMDDAPESSREALLDKFKTLPSCFVMIANPAACAESVSLHRQCNYALYLDRTFNAGSFLQSMDRIHRLGLPADAVVGYELLVSPGTIDEIVDRRLEEKVRRLGRLLDDDALRTVSLDGEEDDGEPFGFDTRDAEAVLRFLETTINK